MATISRSPSYLLQRENTFYYRVGIPFALRERLGRRELRLSLETGYLKTARTKAQLLAAVASAFFSQAQGDQDMAQLSPKQLNKLFSEWLRQALATWEHQHAVGKAKTEDLIAAQQDRIRAELLDIRDSLRMGKYLGYQDEVIAIAAQQGNDIKDDYDDVKHCCHAYVHAKRSYLNILSRRLEGDYDYEVEELSRFKKRQLLLLWDEEPPTVLQVESKPAPRKHRLNLVIEAFIAEKARSGAWSGRSLQELPRALRLLLDAIGNIDIEDIDSEALRQFKAILARLPANRDKLKVTKCKTLQEALEVPDLKPISTTRQNFILSIVSAFFEYAVGNGYILRNPAKGMQIKTKVRQDEERDAFTPEDLEVIFSCPLYTQGKAKHPWQFWLPLLGYFTGARIEELCQLDLADIKAVEGIPVIDINNLGEKRLKNSSSRRVIPIHPYLIKPLGFLGYVMTMQKTEEQKLFPGLLKTQDRYSHGPSQWFRRLRDKLGIKGKKSFHSFRHTFANNLKQAEVSEQAIKELMGHAKDDMTMDRYGKPLAPDTLIRAIMALPLPPRPE